MKETSLACSARQVVSLAIHVFLFQVRMVVVVVVVVAIVVRVVVTVVAVDSCVVRVVVISGSVAQSESEVQYQIYLGLPLG